MENLLRTILRAHPQASAPINGHVPRAHDTQKIWRQLYAQKTTWDPRRKKRCTVYASNITGVHNHRRRHVCINDVGRRSHKHILHRLNWTIPSGILQRYALYFCCVYLQTKCYFITIYENTRRRKHDHRFPKCTHRAQIEGPYTNPSRPRQQVLSCHQELHCVLEGPNPDCGARRSHGQHMRSSGQVHQVPHYPHHRDRI